MGKPDRAIRPVPTGMRPLNQSGGIAGKDGLQRLIAVDEIPVHVDVIRIIIHQRQEGILGHAARSVPFDLELGEPQQAALGAHVYAPVRGRGRHRLLKSKQSPGGGENLTAPAVIRPRTIRVLCRHQVRGDLIEPVVLGGAVVVEINQGDVERLEALHHGEHGLAVICPPRVAPACIGPMPLNIVDRSLYTPGGGAITNEPHFVEQIAGFEDVHPAAADAIFRASVVRSSRRVLQGIDPQAQFIDDELRYGQPEPEWRDRRGVTQPERRIAPVGIVPRALVGGVAPTTPLSTTSRIVLGEGHPIECILQQAGVKIRALAGRQSHHRDTGVVSGMSIADENRANAVVIAISLRFGRDVHVRGFTHDVVQAIDDHLMILIVRVHRVVEPQFTGPILELQTNQSRYPHVLLPRTVGLLERCQVSQPIHNRLLDFIFRRRYGWGRHHRYAERHHNRYRCRSAYDPHDSSSLTC